jgi:hypothetical protein
VVLDHGEVMELDGGTHVLTDRNPRASAPAGAVAYPFDGPGVWTPDMTRSSRCDAMAKEWPAHPPLTLPGVIGPVTGPSAHSC